MQSLLGRRNGGSCDDLQRGLESCLMRELWQEMKMIGTPMNFGEICEDKETFKELCRYSNIVIRRKDDEEWWNPANRCVG